MSIAHTSQLLAFFYSYLSYIPCMKLRLSPVWLREGGSSLIHEAALTVLRQGCICSSSTFSLLTLQSHNFDSVLHYFLFYIAIIPETAYFNLLPACLETVHTHFLFSLTHFFASYLIKALSSISSVSSP